MQAAPSHLDDAGPAAHIALPVVVSSHGDHCAVGLKPHGMQAAPSHLDDAGPAAHIALPVIVSSHGDHSAISLKTHSVSGAGSDHGVDLSRKAGGD